MDEQRILEEMERMLAADDPKLASRLAAFGQPGFGQVLRTRRARATMSAIALVLIAAVAAVIFMMSSLRPSGTTKGPTPRHSAASARVVPRVSPCAAARAPECGKGWTRSRTLLQSRTLPQSPNPTPSR